MTCAPPRLNGSEDQGTKNEQRKRAMEWLNTRIDDDEFGRRELPLIDWK